MVSFCKRGNKTCMFSMNKLWTVQIHDKDYIIHFRCHFNRRDTEWVLFVVKWKGQHWSDLRQMQKINLSNYFGHGIGNFSHRNMLGTKHAFSCCHPLDLRSHQEKTVESSAGHRTQFRVLSEWTQILWLSDRTLHMQVQTFQEKVKYSVNTPFF